MPRHHTDVVDTRDARTIDRFIAHVLSEEFEATRKPIGWTLRLWLRGTGRPNWANRHDDEREAQRLEDGVHERLEGDTELYDHVMAAIHGVEATA